MGDQHARGAGHAVGDFVTGNCRGRTGDDRRRRRDRVHTREKVAFYLEAFQRVFLHPTGPPKRRLKGIGPVNAGPHRTGPIDQPIGFQIGEIIVQQQHGFVERLGEGVVERNFMADPGVDHGPGAADQPSPDDGDCFLHVDVLPRSYCFGREQSCPAAWLAKGGVSSIGLMVAGASVYCSGAERPKKCPAKPPSRAQNNAEMAIEVAANCAASSAGAPQPRNSYGSGAP